DAEDQCQSAGNKKQQKPILHRIQALDQKDGGVHKSSLVLRLQAAAASRVGQCLDSDALGEVLFTLDLTQVDVLNGIARFGQGEWTAGAIDSGCAHGAAHVLFFRYIAID